MPCTRIELQNFRCIERLILDLPAGTQERAGWLVLLGENSAGKSSVLQAVALTLAGERLDEVDYWDLVYRGAEERRGSVRLELSIAAPNLPSASTWAEMRLGPAAPRFESSEEVFWDPAGDGYLLGLGYFFGFGPARWLPRGSGSRSADRWPDWRIRIANLFDPFVPLQDGIYWLEELSDADLRRVAAPLLSVLGRHGDRLEKRSNEVVLAGPGGLQPLRELSDGYQTILAIACEILQVTMGGSDEPAAAEGIVLLDEIESHLHPRWKMRIVDGFRSAFPRMQFIATTHDPLCLRGLDDGEVVVLRRDARGRVVALTDLPPVAGLRADQLLTSEFFGLSSTVDPLYEAIFAEYYALRRLRRLTLPQRGRLDALGTALDRLGMMGTTRRERLMLEAIDDYLARERTRPDTRGTGRRQLSRSLAGILEGLEEV